MKITPFHVTVMPGENALLLRRGQFRGVLTPGRHQRHWDDKVIPVSMKSRTTVLAQQDIGTADALQVRATAVARWKVVDPVAFVQRDEDPQGVLYLALQTGLRDIIGEIEAAVLVNRLRTEPDLTTRLHSLVRQGVAGLGMEVFEVVVRDVVLPVEVRRIAIDLATARARALEQLEEARARTAALRALANGAKLLDDHPALARQQLVASMPPGTQLVLKVDDSEA
ncbi:SPFH domain-containing protein [Propionibacteriaceae bacterium Y1923]|uniref:SPFH domain-containing protein n=1 Tax=Aestuariimicrobium sp. Y1814 TaxID=3418742 RepID=UPI003C152ED3